VRRRPLALLIDAGGTLFPDNLPVDQEGRVRDGRLLGAALPELDLPARLRLLDQIAADVAAKQPGVRQPELADIVALLTAMDGSLGGRAEAVRGVLASRPLPPVFPGSLELLALAGRRGLRRVLVTNVAWSSASDTRRRLGPSGLADALEAIVTSYDVGFRKPHAAMFDAAVRAAACEPSECVMVGDDERRDVEPAVRLGMMVIRVAIQEPSPHETRAHHLVSDLQEVGEVLVPGLTKG
jgi:FMN phosphatase YigB (HAD superfamily)